MHDRERVDLHGRGPRLRHAPSRRAHAVLMDRSLPTVYNPTPAINVPWQRPPSFVHLAGSIPFVVDRHSLSTHLKWLPLALSVVVYPSGSVFS